MVETPEARHKTDDLLVSDWVVTELSSALSVRLRLKHISTDQTASALAILREMT